MAIAPKCDVVTCGLELREFGAILLSPPDGKGFVKKYHLCADCYVQLQKEHFDASPSSATAPERPKSV